MPRNNGYVLAKQLSHLGLRKPNRFVFYSNFQTNALVWLVKDYLLTSSLRHPKIFIE